MRFIEFPSLMDLSPLKPLHDKLDSVLNYLRWTGPVGFYDPMLPRNPQNFFESIFLLPAYMSCVVPFNSVWYSVNRLKELTGQHTMELEVSANADVCGE